MFSTLIAWLQRKRTVAYGGCVLRLSPGLPTRTQELAPGCRVHLSSAGAVLRIELEKPGEYSLDFIPQLILSDRAAPDDPHGHFVFE